MKETVSSIVQSVRGFVKRTGADHVGAYAAQAAYFIILSFIPFLLFMMTLVQYTPLTEDMVKNVILQFIPENIQGLVESIINTVYSRSSGILPLTAVTALWSAAKGLQALTNGLNTIYHVPETRNWLATRIRSVFYTFLLVLALIFSLILLVFGNSIQSTLNRKLPIIADFLGWIMGARTLLVFFVLMLVFLFLYKAVPNRKASLKSQIPGAVLTAIAWSVFSFCFSLYFEFFPSFSNMYGSMTIIILVMLWMYVCMNIVLYGAEVNAYYENQFRQAQAFAKELFDKDKEDEPEEEKKKLMH